MTLAGEDIPVTDSSPPDLPLALGSSTACTAVHCKELVKYFASLVAIVVAVDAAVTDEQC